MQAEILCIGDELLIGQVVNTNAAWLSRELAGIGLKVTRTVCVPDDHSTIVEALTEAMSRVPWVFTTGGLGPTKDDVTKQALVEVFGGTLQFSQDVWDQIVKVYATFGKTASKEHEDQALQPTAAQILTNAMGTAPGLLFRSGNRSVCVMPGVPYEMEFIMTRHVVPIITEAVDGHSVVYRTIATVGQGETVLAGMINEIESSLPEKVTLAYLPSLGRVRIRVTGSGMSNENIAATVDDIAGRIADRLSDVVYATEDISLAKAIGRKLLGSGQTVSVAESCTGGFLSHLFTADSGSSAYFQGGAITYSNALKQSVLGVSSETLESYGAVSEETVREMAEGARTRFSTDYAIAISGIAGPDGGTPEKPVGTVWIAISDSRSTVARAFRFGKDRLRNIELSAVKALDMLRRKMTWEP